MQLSVIIVNYNVCYFLEQCLHSVQKSMGNLSAEVIVVDNNSVDNSVLMVKENFSFVKLIENKKNTGFSYANNQAIKISSGKYVLLLNPDTIVEVDTFSKVLSFMESNENAGGLGVMMIDGKGNFLPESKRGLPTPTVAFFKIFGLAALFPKSKIFGKYHLGFLDKEKIHEVEILSGAFMLLRKSALDKIGLLDEDFFMYGEDIDLSYRLIKGGYKNYYFPETRIIHYKGESTKKSSINYVFVFYRAMVIFAGKHFSQQNAKTFGFLINIAIYIRAFLALITRFIKGSLLPIVDFCLSYTILLITSKVWQQYGKHADGNFFPDRFFNLVLPAYAFIWLMSSRLNGAYDKPIKIYNLVKGLFVGTLAILVIYGLLPESARYSRAVILITVPVLIMVLSVVRFILSKLKLKDFELENHKNNRFAIVGNQSEVKRVSDVLSKTSVKTSHLIFIGLGEHLDKSFFIGNTSQLKEIVEIYKIDEVIFCASDLSSNQIIDFMSLLGSAHVDFKIAPPKSLYIIGSNSLDTAGDLYIIDLKTISMPENVRNKRILDLTVSFLILTITPIVIWFNSNKTKYFTNLFNVFIGKKSWVGYAHTKYNMSLPKIKNGVLSSANALIEEVFDESTLQLMNEHYAKNYQAVNDLKIIAKSLNKLGQ